MNVLPRPGVARQRDLAAEQADELAADREPEPGAAVLARGRAVGLRERLEDRAAAAPRSMPMPVSLTRTRSRTPPRERSWPGSSRRRRADRARATSPRSVNLNALESRFFRIWRRRCGSVTIVAGQPRRRARRRTPRPCAVGDGLELCAACCRAARRARASLISSWTVSDSTLARSRMSLSSFSRSLPEERMTLAYSTWRVGQVAVGVVLELLGEDQQAVERRAQLVRHVGDELRLVLRRDRQLAGLLLDEALRLLDLLVLALGLDVLLGEQRRLLGRGPRSTRAAPPAASCSSSACDCDCSSSFSVTDVGRRSC